MSNQPQIEIYTWQTCPYCRRAKALLDSKGVSYQEISVDGDEAARDAMSQRTGGKRSVPQIFINGQAMGGFTDIQALDRRGQLVPLLEAEPV